MKKTALILVFVLICGMFLPSAAATAPTSGSCGAGLTWSYANGTLTISGSGAMSEYFPPDNRAPWHARAGEIENIVIGDKVTSIAAFAFEGCSKVKTIDIPDSVTGIGMYAFTGCTSLETVNIGKGVADMGAKYGDGLSIFWAWEENESCHNLKAINVAAGNESFKSIDGVLFDTRYGITRLALYPEGKSDRAYTIPEGTFDIGSYAFRWNSHLVSVTIPSGIDMQHNYPSAGVGVFQGCSALKDVIFSEGVKIEVITPYMFTGSGIEQITIPKGVKTIERSAFENCTQLRKISLPSILTSYGDVIAMNAFNNCTALTDIYYAGSEPHWALVTVSDEGNDAFKNATVHFALVPETDPWPEHRGLGDISWVFTGTTLHISGTGDMPDYASKVYASDFNAPWFSHLDDVLSIKIGNGVTSIGNTAFYMFRVLTSVDIPSSVTRIGYGAFIECTSLRSITMPSKVSKIESSTFFGCRALESITLPKAVTSIDAYAFADCESLTDIYYEGTGAQWNAININYEGNDALKNATIHFETKLPGAEEPTATEQPTVPEKPPVSFTDVIDKSVWYYDTVYAAAEAGIIAGNYDGTFAPEGKLTWAQTVTFAARLMQYRNGEHVYDAADQQGVWYQVYVDYALEHGIIDAASLDPNAPISRAGAAIIFAAVLGEDAETVNEVPEGYFSDVPEGMTADAIYTLAAAGIVNGKLDTATNTITYGYDDTFRRSEVATIVARMAGLVKLAEIK